MQPYCPAAHPGDVDVAYYRAHTGEVDVIHHGEVDVAYYPAAHHGKANVT